MKFLAISTSCHRYHDSGFRTGMWLSEYTHFYDVLDSAGHTVDLASVAGGVVPIDPVSLQPQMLSAGGTDKRYESSEFMSRLDSTPAITDVDPSDYAGIYLVGGHGAMYDFKDPAVSAAVAAFADAGKVVSAVCHGPAGLLDVELAGGARLLDGKKVTGYSFAEEKAAHREEQVPFSLEDKLSEQAGDYSIAPEPMGTHVVVDGRLVTGQNPSSAAAVGQAVLELL